MHRGLGHQRKTSHLVRKGSRPPPRARWRRCPACEWWHVDRSVSSKLLCRARARRGISHRATPHDTWQHGSKSMEAGELRRAAPPHRSQASSPFITSTTTSKWGMASVSRPRPAHQPLPGGRQVNSNSTCSAASALTSPWQGEKIFPGHDGRAAGRRPGGSAGKVPSGRPSIPDRQSPQPTGTEQRHRSTICSVFAL